ncbi:MAG TPA: PAC2 family protein [Gaiellaceae bacterium]|jgi:predicted ATP-grasp superfamily ATP-dependent carboligase|nr:PAC2 family protein [Gaiellaceae bacterium]
MSELHYESRPSLERPVLIAAFRGWNDGGQGASLAGAYLARAWAAQEFATIDPENFYDFQATRPMVSLVDGYTRKIEWPENSFLHAPLPGGRRDAIILLGVEPNLRWRTFADLITGLAQEFSVDLVITLGSLLADVPHTRPSPVTGSATDPELIDQLGLQASRYEGPTGMVGVLHDSCARAGLKSASLWAAVPHYVSLTPSPRAAKALVDRLADLLDADVDTKELDEAADSYAQQVSEAVATDEETSAYVADLEQRVDQLEEELDLPSGDAIAAELSRYLRERENDDGDDDVAREH